MGTVHSPSNSETEKFAPMPIQQKNATMKKHRLSVVTEHLPPMKFAAELHKDAVNVSVSTPLKTTVIS